MRRHRIGRETTRIELGDGKYGKTGRDGSPDAKGRAGYRPCMPRGSERPGDGATSRTAGPRVSIASRSWMATDEVSIHPELSAARVSGRSCL